MKVQTRPPKFPDLALTVHLPVETAVALIGGFRVMHSVISSGLLSQLKPDTKPYEIRDLRLKGFLVRVQPSGVMTYYIQYGRCRRMAIGRADAITPGMAREKAKAVLADVYQGKDPMAVKRTGKAHTLGSFIDEVYSTWAKANLRTSDATIARLRSTFRDFLEKKLGEITAWEIEKWRAGRIRDGTKPTTVNRDLDDLRSTLSKAVSWGLLDRSPVSMVKRCRTDPNPPVRFLTDDEESRVRTALADREERIRAGRRQANGWRADRDYPLFPDLSMVNFPDYLRPMVLLSLNTGIRRGELFGLAWNDIDLDQGNLTVRGPKAKSGKTRHIPLNDEARSVLELWQRDVGSSTTLVFPNKAGNQLNNVRRAWLGVLDQARIDGFRWHDLRHTFASRLAMAGVDLNTIRELLGHSDYKMTLRYAHLTPHHKAAAVAKLVRKGEVVDPNQRTDPIPDRDTANG